MVPPAFQCVPFTPVHMCTPMLMKTGPAKLSFGPASACHVHNRRVISYSAVNISYQRQQNPLRTTGHEAFLDAGLRARPRRSTPGFQLGWVGRGEGWVLTRKGEQLGGRRVTEQSVGGVPRQVLGATQDWGGAQRTAMQQGCECHCPEREAGNTKGRERQRKGTALLGPHHVGDNWRRW